MAPFERHSSERVEDLLREWLPDQRWFAGKGRDLDAVSIVSDVELITGDPALHHLIVAAAQGADTDHYQVPLGLRGELPGRLEYAELGVLDDVHAYDAVHDHDLTRILLEYMAADTDAGPLAFRSVPGTIVDTELDSFASPAEQSNTSLIYGDSYICKLFRRITPGVNPDLELGKGLARVGCKNIPALYGWIEMTPGRGGSRWDEPATLAVLSEFLVSGTDGWQLATTSVRDFYAEPGLGADEVGGDFAGEAERLGAATAEVHRDLAAAFGVGEADPAELGAQMSARLDAACEEVPALRPFARRLGDAFAAVARLGPPIPVQRVHGDYHLGQVLRTDSGWMLLDFEGEPARSLTERRAPGHPLRDVAGMLRSFEYAARQLLPAPPPPTSKALDGHHGGEQELRTREWADRNRAAFCRGYAEAGGADPGAERILLHAFEFDKAVYEVVYEARHRPSWLHIPLGSLAAT